jgi:hypothetical protein
MVRSFSGWSVLVALTAALVTMPAVTAQAQNKNTNRLTVPVTGTAAGVGSVAGNFAISKFEIRDQRLVAVGQLTATVTNTTTGEVRTFVTEAAMPVMNGGSAIAKNAGESGAIASCSDETAETGVAACDILSLVLGPLHLDVLGLVIDLNQVVLDITATTGSGDLLGNLLCAITGLLDAGSLGQQVVNLLNQLVGILGAL